jgi:16S rRNA processing protein RimM
LSTEFYVIGRVRRAHGIRGELVVEALTDAPDAIFAAGRRVFAGTRDGALSGDRRELRVVRSSPFKGGLIVAFEGIEDRSAADTWRDRYLLVPESEVQPPDEGELFIHDLVGMQVVRLSGDALGVVTEVFELPQGPMMEVKRERGKPVLLPFNEETVVDVDAERRVIRVDPLEGLVD